MLVGGELMPSHKMNGAIKVALIGAAGVVIAATIPSVSTNIFGKRPELRAEPTLALTSVPPPAPESTLSYSGRVIDANTRAGIQGAQVFVEVDQNQPEPHITDSYGYFHLNVLKDARSFRVRVSVVGYAPFDSGATPIRTGTQEIPVKALARMSNQSSSISSPSKSLASAESSSSHSATPAPSVSAQQKTQEEASAGGNAVSPRIAISEDLSKVKETIRQAIRDYNAKYGKYDLQGEMLNCTDYNNALAALREIKYLAESAGDQAALEFVEKTSPEGHSFRWESCKK